MGKHNQGRARSQCSSHIPSPSSSIPGLFATALLMAMLSLSSAAIGQSGSALPSLDEARTINDRTVGLVFDFEDLHYQYISDFSATMKERANGTAEELQVVPIISENHVQTMLDLLYLRGVDLGIVHADVFAYMAMAPEYEQVYQRIHSVVELAEEKVVVIAGEQYESLEDLNGRRVNFASPGKGSDLTATVLFDTLGIDVVETRFDELDALERVKSGEIAAMVYIIEDDATEFRALSPADNVRIIGIPRDDRLLEHYREAEITGEDFPDLAGETGSIDTVGVSVIIVAYNWPTSQRTRYERSERFINSFVGSLDELKSGDTAERWNNVDPAREVPGTNRLALVDDVLRQQASERERLALEASNEEAAELRERQSDLTQRLEARLDARIAETDDPAELSRLLEQLEMMLDKER